MINYSHFRSSYHLLYVIKRYFGQVGLALVDLTHNIKFPLKLRGKYSFKSEMALARTHDEVAEWLRRWTANPLGSARVGSNPILVEPGSMV